MLKYACFTAYGEFNFIRFCTLGHFPSSLGKCLFCVMEIRQRLEVKYMLKVRLFGTKKELRWFLKKIQRDCRWQVRNISNFSSIERTNGKYKRLYVDVYRNEK